MLDAYRDLIDSLLGTPTTLRRLVAGRSDEDLPLELASVVAELRDRDLAVLQRLQTMTRQRDPYLRALPTAQASAPEEIGALLEGFDAARGDLVSLLMNLTLRDWERTAIDEVEGEITVADEVERHVEFDEEHLSRIQEVLAG